MTHATTGRHISMWESSPPANGREWRYAFLAEAVQRATAPEMRTFERSLPLPSYDIVCDLLGTAISVAFELSERIHEQLRTRDLVAGEPERIEAAFVETAAAPFSPLNPWEHAILSCLLAPVAS